MEPKKAESGIIVDRPPDVAEGMEWNGMDGDDLPGRVRVRCSLR